MTKRKITKITDEFVESINEFTSKAGTDLESASKILSDTNSTYPYTISVEEFDEVHEPKGYHLDEKGTELKHLLGTLLFKLNGVKSFYVGNVLKYVLRHQDKNGKQDLEKAKQYIDMIIEEYYTDKD